MKIEARVVNERNAHQVQLATDGNAHAVGIASRPNGFGSRANGGELLCLALATCYCNDVYREAGRRGIEVLRVEVEAHAEFGGPGDPGRAFRYRASVDARADTATIRELMLATDRVAEVQNTLRTGVAVVFEPGDARAVTGG